MTLKYAAAVFNISSLLPANFLLCAIDTKDRKLLLCALLLVPCFYMYFLQIKFS